MKRRCSSTISFGKPPNHLELSRHIYMPLFHSIPLGVHFNYYYRFPLLKSPVFSGTSVGFLNILCCAREIYSSCNNDYFCLLVFLAPKNRNEDCHEGERKKRKLSCQLLLQLSQGFHIPHSHNLHFPTLTQKNKNLNKNKVYFFPQ